MSGEAPNMLVVLHGVNLNMLGLRPAAHYGTITLSQLEEVVRQEAGLRGWRTLCFQTNHEGEFVELVHRYRTADALLVNPGAWTHYSYAIRDALELAQGPVAEVHLSAVEQREAWRRLSVLEGVTAVRVSGKGPDGYREAVRRLVALVAGKDETQ